MVDFAVNPSNLGKSNSLAIKPPDITSVSISASVVNTGASFILSVGVSDGGFYTWGDWDSTKWGEVSNLIWGA